MGIYSDVAVLLSFSLVFILLCNALFKRQI